MADVKERPLWQISKGNFYGVIMGKPLWLSLFKDSFVCDYLEGKPLWISLIGSTFVS